MKAIKALSFVTMWMAALCALPAQADAVRLLFAGDVMLDDGPGRVVLEGGDPLQPFAALLADADYRIANLECPIASTGAAQANKVFAFRADPRTLAVLTGRFDAVSVANNHSGDYGQAAFEQTLSLLDRAGIARFGGGHDLRQAHEPLWIERGGLRIAVLGYNEYKPRSFAAGANWPGVAWSEDSQVLADIRAARAAGATHVIPFMHWGWELEPGPSARQRQLAHDMIDAGASMVVGGHPHVTQGAEYYRGKPVVYSLGNFVFDGFDYPPAREGWVLRLQLDAQGVVRWDTVVARMDERGVPFPDLSATSPCGARTPAQVMACQASKPLAGRQPPQP